MSYVDKVIGCKKGDNPILQPIIFGLCLNGEDELGWEKLNHPIFGYVIQMYYLCITKWYNYEYSISDKKTDLVSVK